MDYGDPLPSKALESLRLAAVYAFNNIKDNNHWGGEVLTNATLHCQVCLHASGVGSWF